MKTTMRLLMLLAVSVAFGSVHAGSLNPPGAPGPTMVTLQQIYDRQHETTQSDTCFDNDGTNRIVECAGSGGLGTSNGSVKDTQTGLIWLKTANCFGALDWASASIKAAQLASGQCGLTDGSKAGDWRLPTQAEWAAIVKPSCVDYVNPALPSRNATGCYGTGAWATGAQLSDYWSSSTDVANPLAAWTGSLYTGMLYIDNKVDAAWVWPVRSGR